MFADNTYADACLARITDKKRAFRLEMNGKSMREPVYVRGKMILPSHGKEFFTSYGKHFFTRLGRHFFT